MSYKKKCEKCGKDFVSTMPHTKYCSKGCKPKYYGEAIQCDENLPTSTVGAASELMVAADLLRQGYEVFRSISPVCSCDLVILKDGTAQRVEVRTGRESESGKKYVSSIPRKGGYDVLAALYPSGIVYDPPLKSSVLSQ